MIYLISQLKRKNKGCAIKKKYEEKREKVLQRNKEYYEKNKQEILQRHKEYQKQNKEKVLQYHRKYNQKPERIKSRRIYDWKRMGLICDDMDGLYEHYLKTTHCDECEVELTYDKNNTPTTKCLDHCHESGMFRNILCLSCNVKRG